jgi:hypothetical protein
MANHCRVKTKKKMTPAGILRVFRDLNATILKGNLGIVFPDYVDGVEDDPNTWQVVYLSDRKEWVRRMCWLNSSRSFELRHSSGGGHFAWWIATVITNEVAVRFDGVIEDDGVDEKWPGVPNKYDRFDDYLKDMLSCIPKKHRKEMLTLYKKLAPPEFRK